MYAKQAAALPEPYFIMAQTIICVLLWIVGAAYTSFNEPAPEQLS